MNDSIELLRDELRMLRHELCGLRENQAMMNQQFRRQKLVIVGEDVVSVTPILQIVETVGGGDHLETAAWVAYCGKTRQEALGHSPKAAADKLTEQMAADAKEEGE